MKKMGNKGLVMVGFLLACMLNVSPAKAQGSVSLQVFYDELQPYGTWMHHNNYGYVWMPRVERGFVPYGTSGYWVSTEYGNTWVSDYSWGWAPFHYGRWFYDDFYGWMWVPDTVWGPAWVAWRSGGGYYGWAPLMPGLGFSVSFSYYNRIPHHYWSFVPYRYITYRSVHRHCVPRTQVVNVINHTTIITNNYTDNRRRTYLTGPSRREIERSTQERVRTYSVADLNQPGRTAVERDRVSFYKPDIDDSKRSRSASMPSRYVRENSSGRLEQIEARRGNTSESSRQRSLENDRSGTLNQRNFERGGSTNNLDQFERNQQREIQREDDAFERFRRERETPSREVAPPRTDEMRQLEQRNNNLRDEQLRSNNELRKQQLERQNESIREQQNMQRENNLREEQRRLNNGADRGQQFDRQNEMMEQRNLQRQRDNTRMEQQRNMENSRQQFDRQNSQREFTSPNENRRMERQPQSLQRMERPGQGRFNRSNSNFEQRQSGGSQNEIRKSTFDQRSGGGSKGQGGGNNSPRRRN